MNKFATTVLLLLFPALALADSNTLTFAPPASDYSVIFLGNLFGIVDGVLHGTGSQIMGNMFGVLNSAVLALGGIIIMYTLIVSTMNTAHEGQMLGQKWSSIWIPVRSTLGLALLIPKASGYCLMQIFVMWIVLQGVGAADNIWSAALSYLNRGGVIIQAQVDPTTSLTESAKGGVSAGALNILAGQVCMYGLQKKIETQRQYYLDLKNDSKSGPCYGHPTETMKTFCATTVPDFLSSVNAVIAQGEQQRHASSFSVPMPHFPPTSLYQFLNGICGTIEWNELSSVTNLATGTGETGTKSTIGAVSVSGSEMETAKMSRAIAIQQMYMDLSTIAQVMVNNDPDFSSSSAKLTNMPYSLVANQQFGVPYTSGGLVCENYSQVCQIWGPLAASSNTNSGVLFNGTEFLGAINDYNGIMMPTLNLIQQNKNAKSAQSARTFIANASTQGWMMAGAYFFDLVKLNGNAVTGSNQYDMDTGLDRSTFEASSISTAFGSNGCIGPYALLCTWFERDATKLNPIEALIDGSELTLDKGGQPLAQDPVAKPNLAPNPKRTYISGLQSSTVYGFVNNSVMIQLPGQPGLKPLEFDNLIHFTVDTTVYYLPHIKFDCGRFFGVCIGRMFGELFYNVIFKNVYNLFLATFSQFLNQVVMAFLMIPIQGMAGIFKVGMNIISMPGVNPIIALANMGVMYINFSASLWMMLMNMAVSTSIIPWFGVFIFALMSLALPLIMGWVGIMVGIGFTTAYYIPLLPYMIFTFGTIAWLMAVIEAMVAAPLVALGITHPEGHDAFGKGEPAIMILMNVFLRPSMMIIGYISAIALSYVGVWVLNAGFDHAIGFINTGISSGDSSGGGSYSAEKFNISSQTKQATAALEQSEATGLGNYTGWAGVFAYFFSILSYTSMYLIMVQKAFTLISYLPDKVLRWIGGNPESIGSESAQWGDEMKQAVKGAGDETQKAQGQMDKQVGAETQKAIGGAKEKLGKLFSGGGNSSGTGSNSTPSSGDGGSGGGDSGGGMPPGGGAAE